ncbi:ArsR/SmtB family transcription factor [Streptomyces sp. NPDC015125]|uniref:ArsR/SmtB family transcription factor n=1 Tax=Streptomyces sp. NPDC015125 TaxID=3364938 RepID=UPI0036FAB278
MRSANQWITETEGRIAPNGLSWLEAVHWFADYGPHAADRSHGPTKVGRTTLRIARALAHLRECRPSVRVLVDWLQIAARTVKYHLGILREAGLLTYHSKGTRVAGIGGRASEFARTIPPIYDEALGLRTRPSETLIRSVRGFSKDRIPLMKELHAKARRPLPWKRTKAANQAAATPTSDTAPCTPLVVTTSALPTAGDTPLPSESKLASGKPTSSTRKQNQTPERRKRSLNAVGRRYQLAHELITQVPWLTHASTPRIAWIVRHVADAGWTTAEVIAVISQENPTRRVHRPSGFLAARLRGAVDFYNTPERRAAIVAWWQDSRQAEKARHTEWEGQWQAPTSQAVTRQVNTALAQLGQRAEPDGDAPTYDVGDDGLIALEQLDPSDIIDLRTAAQKDPLIIRTTIARCGEPYARRLFTNRLVDQVKRIAGTGRLVLHTYGGLA